MRSSAKALLLLKLTAAIMGAGHICGLPFNDFAIERGRGYFVKSNSSGTVTPTAIYGQAQDVAPTAIYGQAQDVAPTVG